MIDSETHSFESILEIIRSTIIADSTSVSKTIESVTRFFTYYSLNESAVYTEFIQLIIGIIQKEDTTIDDICFATHVLRIVVCSPQFTVDDSFLEETAEALFPLLSVPNEFVTSNMMSILAKIAAHSMQCTDFITENFFNSSGTPYNETIEGIIRQTSNKELFHAVLDFYSAVIRTKGNESPVEQLESVFQAIMSIISSIVTALDPSIIASIDETGKEVLTDIFTFLFKISDHHAWYSLIIGSSILEYVNVVLLFIKGTRFKFALLKVIQKIIEYDTLSCDSSTSDDPESTIKTKLNIEKLIELMHHTRPLISYHAILCISSMSESTFSQMISGFGIHKVLAEIFVGSPCKTKELILEIYDKMSLLIDWTEIYSDEFLSALIEMIPIASIRTKRRIFLVILRTLSSFETQGNPDDIINHIRDVLLENGVEEMLFEIVDNPSMQQAVELLNDSTKLLSILQDDE